MIRELQILDKELSKANTVTVLRRDFTMYERNFTSDVAPFLKEIEKTARREKLPRVGVVAMISD